MLPLIYCERAGMEIFWNIFFTVSCFIPCESTTVQIGLILKHAFKQTPHVSIWTMEIFFSHKMLQMKAYRLEDKSARCTFASVWAVFSTFLDKELGALIHLCGQNKSWKRYNVNLHSATKYVFPSPKFQGLFFFFFINHMFHNALL